MTITNTAELRQAYDDLSLLEMIARDPRCQKPEKAAQMIADTKRKIRAYQSGRDGDGMERRIVKDNGLDGYAELVALPESVHSLRAANEFFDDYIKLVCTWSAYDCTGQLFTGWYHIFQRHGRYFVYHGVCCDC